MVEKGDKYKQAINDGDDDEGEGPSKLVQSRFARTIAELQFLGFVKPSGRKADHISRLSWGK